MTTPDPSPAPSADAPEMTPEDLEYADPYEGVEFGPYDPTGVTDIPLGTPMGNADADDPETPPFDERYKEDFEGLAFLGALEARFSYLGHRFVIRTLTTHELLAVGQVIKDYAGSMGEQRAYATAMVAMSIVTVDGIGLPTPIAESDRELTWAHERFDYVKARWYPFVLDHVYDRILMLEGRVRDVLVEMNDQAKKA